MKISKQIRMRLKKLLLTALFVSAIAGTAKIAVSIGGNANATTVGFVFLVVVVLSAVFGGLSVAIVTSFVATLFFNYNFFPPFGTFRITYFADWIALSAFLFTSIVISRLTASARENAHKVEVLESAVAGIKEFGTWLLSVPREMLTLSAIAENTLRIFALEYCSIHVYAEGRWHHFSGTSLGKLSQGIADSLKKTTDHPTGMMELVDEQGLGVRYSHIRAGSDSFAVVAVRSKDLPGSIIDTIASMVGVFLSEALGEKVTPFSGAAR